MEIRALGSGWEGAVRAKQGFDGAALSVEGCFMAFSRSEMFCRAINPYARYAKFTRFLHYALCGLGGSGGCLTLFREGHASVRLKC